MHQPYLLRGNEVRKFYGVGVGVKHQHSQGAKLNNPFLGAKLNSHVGSNTFMFGVFLFFFYVKYSLCRHIFNLFTVLSVSS